MRIGLFVFGIAMCMVALYFVMPVPTLFSTGWKIDASLYDDSGFITFPFLAFVREPYNCMSVMKCDEVCTGWSIFGICIGGKEKINCRAVEECQYKTTWVPDITTDYTATSYNPYTTETSCPSGTVYSNGLCQSIYSDYTFSPSEYYPTNICTTTVTEVTRLVCGGDVIQNSYITGFRSITEQVIEKTCNTCGSCSETIKSSKVVEDCVKNYRVCRDDTGTPHCVVYPVEMKIHTILDQLGGISK